MPAKTQWATIEGGMAQGFPLSLNQAADWLSLRRGECSAQDMADYEVDGILRYAATPSASSGFFSKKFVAYDKPTGDLAQDEINFLTYNGNSFWIEPDEGKNLVYNGGATPSAGGATTVTLSGGTIKLIVEMGDSRILILKDDRGFVFDMDPNELLISTPYYGIGSSNEGVKYSNAVWNGNAALTWSAGSSGYRHFLWDGRGEAVELSRLVRAYASEPPAPIMPAVNWAKNLIIFGNLVYDMEYKRALYYSGKTSCSLTTRPYYHVHFHPVLLTKLAFFCNGKSGSFTATIEYGQAQDRLQRSKTFKVNVTDATKTRVRHVWTIENPIRCRVWRVVISDLVGLGITQIDALTAIDDGPDSYDGES